MNKANDKLSIIIPSCREKFLDKTVDGILESATGDIEIIIYLDKYWPNPPIKNNKKVTIIHASEKVGMRPGINAAVRIATGKYLMKCDGHCLFDKGFDEKLKADCEPNWLAVPSRYSLDSEKWERTRGPVDHLFLTFPCANDELYGNGFHGRKWKGEEGLEGGFFHREKARKDILIDDIIAFQGSCWFMHRELFDKIGRLDDFNYGTSGNEAQELSFKVWLSGGRVVRNKKTWYAHMHRSGDNKRDFFLSKKTQYKSYEFSYWCWMNNKWPGQVRDLKWLIDKFSPMEGWPSNWHEKTYIEGYKYI